MRDKVKHPDAADLAELATAAQEQGTGIIGGEHEGRGPGPVVMAADTLEGDRVVNLDDEDLGKISNIMIDVPTGRVAYAVLASGGMLGLGNKLFAIPWSALTLDADRHRFILNVDKERLKAAPGFDKDAWPLMADLQWASNVYEYYAAKPYWEE